MLTRTQVAQRLGRSVATVRRMEGKSLNPTRDGAGVYRFEEDEVDRVAAQVAETGRALESSNAYFPNSGGAEENDDSSEWSAPVPCSDCLAFERRANEAETAVRNMRLTLLREQNDQERWRTDVERDVATLVRSIGEVDDGVLDAIEVLSERFRKH